MVLDPSLHRLSSTNLSGIVAHPNTVITATSDALYYLRGFFLASSPRQHLFCSLPLLRFDAVLVEISSISAFELAGHLFIGPSPDFPPPGLSLRSKVPTPTATFNP